MHLQKCIYIYTYKYKYTYIYIYRFNEASLTLLHGFPNALLTLLHAVPAALARNRGYKAFCLLSHAGVASPNRVNEAFGFLRNGAFQGEYINVDFILYTRLGIRVVMGWPMPNVLLILMSYFTQGLGYAWS